MKNKTIDDKLDNEIWLFNHKVIKKMEIAYTANDEIEQKGRNNDRVELVNAAKNQCRDYFELIIKGKVKAPNIPHYSVKRIKEAYKRSDFDWTDMQRLNVFCNWLLYQNEESNKNL